MRMMAYGIYAARRLYIISYVRRNIERHTSHADSVLGKYTHRKRHGGQPVSTFTPNATHHNTLGSLLTRRHERAALPSSAAGSPPRGFDTRVLIQRNVLDNMYAMVSQVPSGVPAEYVHCKTLI